MVESRKRKIDRDACLDQYKNYMGKTRGLAEATQRSYLLIARRLLESLSKGRRIKLSLFNAAAVVEFVKADASPRSGQGPPWSMDLARFGGQIRAAIFVPQLQVDWPPAQRYSHSSQFGNRMPSFYSFDPSSR